MVDILLQAKIQSGKILKLLLYPKNFLVNILKGKKLSIGFDPKLYTNLMLNRFLKNLIVN